MEKIMTTLALICLMSVLLLCGCNETKKDISGETYTWTAKQVIDDIPTDLDWNDGIQLLYNTLKDGDTLIIQDKITGIYYDSENDVTTITFEWSEGEESNSYTLLFEGDITDSFQADTNVRITVTIKYVTLTYQGFSFEMEIYEEQWESIEYFKSDLDSGGEGLKPLPQSCIEIL